MPWESIGSVSTGNLPHEEALILFCLGLAKRYVEFVCGKAPPGCNLDIMSEDHDLGSNPSLGVWFEYDPPWDYIHSCERTLEVFDNAVSCFDLKEHFEDQAFPDEEKKDEHPDESERKPSYRIFTGDNFHLYDETEVDDGGTYATEEEAIAAARMIVDKSLRWERRNIRNKYDPDELYDQYTDFGDSPVIRPDTEPPFSAWDYARGRCVEICKEPF